MVLNLYKGMQALGDKVRQEIRHIWPMVISMRKKTKGSWGTDIIYRPR
jgi:hypothetical protein